MKNWYKKSEFKLYKRHYAEIAEELGYGIEVSSKIMHAKSEEEIDRIMVSARNSKI